MLPAIIVSIFSVFPYVFILMAISIPVDMVFRAFTKGELSL